MPDYCCCCSRQFVDRDDSSDYYVSSRWAVRMCSNTCCCAECARDLDELGLFPEERMLLEGGK